jgi:hypothetical protein
LAVSGGARADDAQSSFYSDGAMIGVRLMVLDDEYDEAREILKGYKA